MKLNKSISALAAAAALGFSGHSAAIGTAADTLITNTVNVTYRVGGATTDTNKDYSAKFRVDNKVDMTLTSYKDGVETKLSTDAANLKMEYFQFSLVNSGNSNQHYKLSVVNTPVSTVIGTYTDGDGAASPADVNLPLSFKVYQAAPTTNALTATEITNGVVQVNASADQATADANPVYFWVGVEIPATGLANANTAVMELIAAASNSAGTLLTSDNATDKNTYDASTDTGSLVNQLNVFADGADADSSGQFNGQVSNYFAIKFEVGDLADPDGKNPGDAGYAGPLLDAKVINDPICEGAAVTTASTDKSAGGCVAGYGLPKAIPGALVEFTFTATNNGSDVVKGLSLVETLSAEFADNSMTYVTDSAKKGVTGSLTTITPVPAVSGNQITVNFGDVNGVDDKNTAAEADDEYTEVIVKYRGLLK